MKYAALVLMILLSGCCTVCYTRVVEESAKADLYNPQGEKVGAATLTQTPHGVLISAELANLPPGTHAFHIHAVGQCEPTFKSAGGHFNPCCKEHGILNSKGKHAGDMPNIHVGADGTVAVEVLADEVNLGKCKNGLFDADGSALVIHAGLDDYTTDPTGNAGPRIACGVVTK